MGGLGKKSLRGSVSGNMLGTILLRNVTVVNTIECPYIKISVPDQFLCTNASPQFHFQPHM